MQNFERARSPHTRNVIAFSVAGLALGFAHFNFDPFSAGAEGGGPRRASAAPACLTATPAIATTGAEGTNVIPTVQMPGTSVNDDPGTLRGIWAIKMASALLEKGCKNFATVPDYTASMFKQERINGALGDGQVVELKVRHEPFSVYMKWQSGDRGRQAIYVHGQNEGNMLVQPGGIKGRLTGLLSIEPTGNIAMSDSRHPITDAGLLQLGYKVLDAQKNDVARKAGFTCELRDHQEFEGRPCFLYQINYDSPADHEIYRKSLIYVDKELSLPICVKNFTWTKDASSEKLDEETLIEFYAYTDLKIQQQLGSSDFDRNNRDYKLRVRQ